MVLVIVIVAVVAVVVVVVVHNFIWRYSSSRQHECDLPAESSYELLTIYISETRRVIKVTFTTTFTMITESIPTNEQLAQAATAEVLDKDGNKYTFGELTNGKRVVVVFIRHFCGYSPHGLDIGGVRGQMALRAILMRCRVWDVSGVYIEVWSINATITPPRRHLW